MATLQIPPSNRVMPGSYLPPSISFPEPVDGSDLPPDPDNVVAKWASSFNDLIEAGKTDLSTVFYKDSYWRDILCLSWDLHTFSGLESVQSFVEGHLAKWRMKSINADISSNFRRPKNAAIGLSGQLKCIQSFVTVETDVGRGGGFVRLLPDENGNWKCYTLLTVLQELAGHEEMNYGRRPKGTDHGSHPGRNNWKEERTREQNVEDDEPIVLIVGCGQGGLTIAARLKQLGIRSLVIDPVPNVGDNWRNRYHHLVLHDSVWFDHLPYLNFPPQWPVFTPKDKLADWFEAYAKLLELNIWTSSALKSSKWDESKQVWTVDIEREVDGKKKDYTFHPRHVILATGASGKPSMPSIPGIENFKGDRIVHSSQFPGFSPDVIGKGKNAVIVGCCNSGHDIAQDYYEHGYSVTMVQRSSTLVVSGQTIMDVVLGGLYCEGGPPVEDADIINYSFPSPVAKRFHVDITAECFRRDADTLSGLQSAGFSLDAGPDSAGLWIKYLSRGGGYYIDTGCSSLITSGKIKVKACSVEKINEHSITFTDGQELEADDIVFATGYGNMRETAGEIFGEEVAEQAGEVWGFDEEGETRGMWRRSGKEGFWFMGGNLALCRFYSRVLALQIKGLEEGMYAWGDK